MVKNPNHDLKDMDAVCNFKNQDREPKLGNGLIKDQWPYLKLDPDVKPKSRTPNILQSPKSRFRGHGCFLHLQNPDREPKLGTLVYKKPSDYIQIKIKMQNPIQEPPAPINDQKQDLKNI